MDKDYFDYMRACVDEYGAEAVAVPPDRLAALRQAFTDTANDKDFITELEQRGGSVELLKYDEMEQLIAKLYKTSPDVVAAAREILRE